MKINIKDYILEDNSVRIGKLLIAIAEAINTLLEPSKPSKDVRRIKKLTK